MNKKDKLLELSCSNLEHCFASFSSLLFCKCTSQKGSDKVVDGKIQGHCMRSMFFPVSVTEITGGLYSVSICKGFWLENSFE